LANKFKTVGRVFGGLGEIATYKKVLLQRINVLECAALPAGEIDKVELRGCPEKRSLKDNIL
jgi:hypothetical protein